MCPDSFLKLETRVQVLQPSQKERKRVNTRLLFYPTINLAVKDTLHRGQTARVHRHSKTQQAWKHKLENNTKNMDYRLNTKKHEHEPEKTWTHTQNQHKPKNTRRRKHTTINTKNPQLKILRIPKRRNKSKNRTPKDANMNRKWKKTQHGLTRTQTGGKAAWSWFWILLNSSFLIFLWTRSNQQQFIFCHSTDWHIRPSYETSNQNQALTWGSDTRANHGSLFLNAQRSRARRAALQGRSNHQQRLQVFRSLCENKRNLHRSQTRRLNRTWQVSSVLSPHQVTAHDSSVIKQHIKHFTPLIIIQVSTLHLLSQIKYSRLDFHRRSNRDRPGAASASCCSLQGNERWNQLALAFFLSLSLSVSVSPESRSPEWTIGGGGGGE